MKKTILSFVPAAVLAALGGILSMLPAVDFLGFVCRCLAILGISVALLMLLRRRKPSLAKVLSWILIGLLAVGLVMVITVGVLVADAAAADETPNCRYILVLGARVGGTALQERTEEAFRYLSAHPDTIAVLSGGQGSEEHCSEAQYMFDALTERGIDPERLWMEENATSTWENLQYSLALLQEKTGAAPETVGIVTSEYHLYRASHFAKKWGVTAVGIPAKTENCLYFVNNFLREIAGVWHYILLGGLYHD